MTDVIFSENYIVVYEEVIFMTYKQIEAAREVRQAIATKANSIKQNIESKMHKREA